MRIDILTVVPELLESPLSHSIVGRAIKKGLVDIRVHNLRKYGIGPRKNVDDYSYGGDAGMVMRIEPVYNMIQELRAERDYDNCPSRRTSSWCAATTRASTTVSASTSSHARFPWATTWSAAARSRRPSWRTPSSA